MANKETLGIGLLFTWALVVASTIFWLGPIPQNMQYHHFADTERYLALPNALNVISNLPLIWLGISGFLAFSRGENKTLQIVRSNLLAYRLLFLSVALAGFGSSYYHLEPSNDALLWDRLPIAMGFMSLFSIVIAEYISVAVGRRLLWPLVVVGALSVFYWWSSESMGAGDLRPYLLVQFLPILTLPIVLLCFKTDYVAASRYWLLLACYVLAKLFEHFDYQIYELSGVISGHTLKHLMPVLGLWFPLKAYQKEQV